MGRTLIKGAAIVSMDPKIGDLRKGDILMGERHRHPPVLVKTTSARRTPTANTTADAARAPALNPCREWSHATRST